MVKTIFYILLSSCFSASGTAFIKGQLKNKNLDSLNEWSDFLFNMPFVIGSTLVVFSAVTLFKALSTNNFSLVIPIATGVNFVFTIVIGYYFFHDKLSIASFIGFILILSGILILSL